MKGIAAGSATITAALTGRPHPAQGWRYKKGDNTWATNGWQQIEGKWYYFNEASDGTRGALMTNTQIGEYYVNEEGVWVE